VLFKTTARFINTLLEVQTIALMAGEIASLFLSRMAVPVIYYLTSRT